MTRRTTIFMLVAHVLALTGCGGAGQAGQATVSGGTEPASEWVIGQWRIASESGAGPSMVIVMDSVVEHTIHGHVMRYMSGNAGLGPHDFHPFVATPTSEGLIPLTVELTDPASPPIRLVFERVSDRLEIRAFQLGNEDMMARGRRWVARREAR